MTVQPDWEQWWAPYDAPTYQQVLAYLRPYDVVLDIGAGDLRLARQMAQQTQRVYAIERNAHHLPAQSTLPPNLSVVCGDARELDFPAEVTIGVLLMRHCRHMRFYVQKLLQSGCRWLVTNARWGMNVERIDLFAERRPYTAVALGWYACLCGQTGFIPGPSEMLTPQLENYLHEVQDCPACAPKLYQNTSTSEDTHGWHRHRFS